MEYYLNSAASWSVFKAFKQFSNTNPLQLEQRRTQLNDIIKKFKSHFYGWIMFHVNSVGVSGRNQMFYVKFANHYFGLSRDGINFQSKFG